MRDHQLSYSSSGAAVVASFLRSFAGELGAAYKRALIMYGIDPPV